MSLRSRTSGGMLALLLTVGCQRRTSYGCVPGATVACACTTGQTGAQSCGADGQYGPCACTAAAAPAEAPKQEPPEPTVVGGSIPPPPTAAPSHHVSPALQRGRLGVGPAPSQSSQASPTPSDAPSVAAIPAVDAPDTRPHPRCDRFMNCVACASAPGCGWCGRNSTCFEIVSGSCSGRESTDCGPSWACEADECPGREARPNCTLQRVRECTCDDGSLGMQPCFGSTVGEWGPCTARGGGTCVRGGR